MGDDGRSDEAAALPAAPEQSAGDVGLSAGLPPGSLLDVSPSLGNVIEVGGTVTVTVSGRT